MAGNFGYQFFHKLYGSKVKQRTDPFDSLRSLTDQGAAPDRGRMPEPGAARPRAPRTGRRPNFCVPEIAIGKGKKPLVKSRPVVTDAGPAPDIIRSNSGQKNRNHAHQPVPFAIMRYFNLGLLVLAYFIGFQENNGIVRIPERVRYFMKNVFTAFHVQVNETSDAVIGFKLLANFLNKRAILTVVVEKSLVSLPRLMLPDLAHP